MVFIWRGLGFLVLFIIAGCGFATYFLFNKLAYGYMDRHWWPMALASFVAAVICLGLGRWLNAQAPPAKTEAEVSKPEAKQGEGIEEPWARHSMYWIPVQGWALILFVISGFMLLAEFPGSTPSSKTVQAGSSTGAPNPAASPKGVSLVSEKQLDDPTSLGPVIVIGKDFKPVTLPEVLPEELKGKRFALFLGRRSADSSATTFETLPVVKLRLEADGKIQSLASVPQGDFADKYAHWMLKKNTLVFKDSHGIIVQAYAARATGGMSGLVTIGTDSQEATRCRLEPIVEP